MSHYEPTSDLKIFVGHCDLYFMIMSQCNAAFALNNVGHSDLFFQGPVILPYILKSVSEKPSSPCHGRFQHLHLGMFWFWSFVARFYFNG